MHLWVILLLIVIVSQSTTTSRNNERPQEISAIQLHFSGSLDERSGTQAMHHLKSSKSNEPNQYMPRSPQERISIPESLVISFISGNSTYILDLEYSFFLLKADDSKLLSKVSIVGDGKVEEKSMSPHSFYRGQIFKFKMSNLSVKDVNLERAEHVGWARLQVLLVEKEGIRLEGTIKLGGRFYNIKRIVDYPTKDNVVIELPDDSVIFKGTKTYLEVSRFDQGIATSTNGISSTPIFQCGHDRLTFNSAMGGATSYMAQSVNDFYSREAHGHVPRDTQQRNVGAAQANSDLISRFFPKIKFEGSEKNLTRQLKWPLKSEISTSESGCSSVARVLYMGVAADCAYSELFGNDMGKIESSILQVWNIVSGIYEETFNVQLGIIRMQIMRECSKSDEEAMRWNISCKENSSISDKLNSFSLWRGTQDEEAGLWHLVSGCKASKIVGIAWLNQLCNTKMFKTVGSNDIVSGTGVTIAIDNMYAVVAHEIGHNFGAVHDCVAEVCSTAVCSGLSGANSDTSSSGCPCCPCGSGCDCKNAYIMNPESGGLSPTEFSECAVREICQKNLYYGKCLQVPGTKRIITGNVCGNGIKEVGEECDCGSDENCAKDPCCNTGCKLKPEAKCSPLHDGCCTDKCQIIEASKGQVCLTSKDPCQVASICDGVSAVCPPRKMLPDGTPCNSTSTETTSISIAKDPSGLQCASGVCTSRDAQCRLIGRRSSIIGACPFENIGLFNECALLCQTSGGGVSRKGVKGDMNQNQRDLKGNACVYLDASFIDGTPCTGGFCYSGQCSGGTMSRVSSWFTSHQTFSWTLLGCAIVGFTSLLAWFLYSKFKGARNKRKRQQQVENLLPTSYF